MELTHLSDRTTEYAGPVGTHDINGIMYPEYVTEHSLNLVRDFEVREDDVWIVAFPKAGTHWIGEIAKLVLVDGHKEKIDRSQQSQPISFGTYLAEESLCKRALAWASPRLLNTHLQEHLIPTQLHQGKGKMIYVVRNPKDSAVSMYYFLKPRNYQDLSDWDRFVELYGTEKMRWGSWYSHVLGYWEKRNDFKNMLFLKYEDVKADTRRAIQQIAKFLNHPLSDDALQRVLENVSLREMKKTYHVAGESNYGKQKVADKVGGAHLIRKGTIGDWKNKFTVAQSEVFDKIYQEKMAGSGLNLQFQ
ncbi:sulfotransferase 1C2-like [Acanthaster planci]|uniref:Sulfotransferase 1C2-like n=1 Tax=Acanthaster planci TaxID=133434 RepID=A0A8B7ZTK1_ACAPL|nr:sulfotransferase 1C2-like [Acanthaster planci]XP_022106812.1 sulfotransferase 1C2-like [Acanthaster planci]XP_022106813.1 sulfotransferase 1C2-like [Acanthaster planci]